MAWMYKEVDGKITTRGASGPMNDALWPDDWEKCYSGEKVEINVEHNARPRLGVIMRVGSITYSSQDWYQTSQIVLIMKDVPEQVRFKTLTGSIYIWRP